MEIRNFTALVTGANRGLGSTYVEVLLAAGARRIYPGARDPATITNPRVIPLRLDVMTPQQVAAAASVCRHVSKVPSAEITLDLQLVLELRP